MTAPLTPVLALSLLRELSLDVRSAVVLDAAGEPLAGDRELATAVRRGAEDVLVVRGSEGLSIAVLAGPRAIMPLLEHDLARLVDAIAVSGATDA